MAIVILLVARIDGTPTPYDGLYVKHYDPTVRDGAITLDAVLTPAEAKQFPSLFRAVEYYRRVSPNVPYDSPGHINRPLTCYTVKLEPVEDKTSVLCSKGKTSCSASGQPRSHLNSLQNFAVLWRESSKVKLDQPCLPWWKLTYWWQLSWRGNWGFAWFINTILIHAVIWSVTAKAQIASHPTGHRYWPWRYEQVTNYKYSHTKFCAPYFFGEYISVFHPPIDNTDSTLGCNLAKINDRDVYWQCRNNTRPYNSQSVTMWHSIRITEPNRYFLSIEGSEICGTLKLLSWCASRVGKDSGNTITDNPSRRTKLVTLNTMENDKCSFNVRERTFSDFKRTLHISRLTATNDQSGNPQENGRNSQNYCKYRYNNRRANLGLLDCPLYNPVAAVLWGYIIGALIGLIIGGLGMWYGLRPFKPTKGRNKQ